MNTCPVYRRSGGLSYGATYSGPIGLIIAPTFNARKYSNLPFASTLSGSCSNVCPGKINIHEQIYAWTAELGKPHEPFAEKAEMNAAGELLSYPAASAPLSQLRTSCSPICRGSSSTTRAVLGAGIANEQRYTICTRLFGQSGPID